MGDHVLLARWYRSINNTFCTWLLFLLEYSSSSSWTSDRLPLLFPSSRDACRHRKHWCLDSSSLFFFFTKCRSPRETIWINISFIRTHLYDMIDTKISRRTSYKYSSTEWIWNDHTHCPIGPPGGLHGIDSVITTSNEVIAGIESIPCCKIWPHPDFLCIWEYHRSTERFAEARIHHHAMLRSAV